MRRSELRNGPLLVLLLASLALFALANYGGLRSPDSEILYQVAESLAVRGSFAVPERLEGWEEFGLAEGRDGQLYAAYGPLQALAAVPWVRLALLLEDSRWFDRLDYVPPSHYVGQGLREFGLGQRPADLQPHARRFVVSFFNVPVSAAGVAVLVLMLLRLGCSRRAALLTALLYAFGTLTWAYSGTFFREPLSLLLVLVSLWVLMEADPALGKVHGDRRWLAPAVSGSLLGLAVAAHITATLFVPFGLAYAAVALRAPAGTSRADRRSIAAYAGGVAAVGIALAAYNVARFGSPLETGRGAIDAFPLLPVLLPSMGRNLASLLLSPGKGLLLYCPAVLLGAIAWPKLHRKHRPLSWILLAAIGTRLLFTATLDVWHGGFCIGPRYLLMVVPLLMLPIGLGIDRLLRRNRPGEIAVALAIAVAAVSEQMYLFVGEIFSYFHIWKWHYEDQGIDVFVGHRLYTEGSMSPLRHLLEYQRGPFLLQGLEATNDTLWLAGTTLSVVAACSAFFVLARRRQSS